MATRCAHAWQIEPPDSGQVSSGTCAKCGATKRFYNYGAELRLLVGKRLAGFRSPNRKALERTPPE